MLSVVMLMSLLIVWLPNRRVRGPVGWWLRGLTAAGAVALVARLLVPELPAVESADLPAGGWPVFLLGVAGTAAVVAVAVLDAVIARLGDDRRAGTARP